MIPKFLLLKQIVQTIQNQGARVIIGGLRFPGKDRGYGQAYEDLSRQTGAMLIPDIYAEIVDNPNLMSDSIHPNGSGYRIIARRFSDKNHLLLTADSQIDHQAQV